MPTGQSLLLFRYDLNYGISCGQQKKNILNCIFYLNRFIFLINFYKINKEHIPIKFIIWMIKKNKYKNHN